MIGVVKILFFIKIQKLTLKTWKSTEVRNVGMINWKGFMVKFVLNFWNELIRLFQCLVIISLQSKELFPVSAMIPNRPKPGEIFTLCILVLKLLCSNGLLRFILWTLVTHLIKCLFYELHKTNILFCRLKKEINIFGEQADKHKQAKAEHWMRIEHVAHFR